MGPIAKLSMLDAFFRWFDPHYAIAADGVAVAGRSDAFCQLSPKIAGPSPMTVLAVLSALGVALLLWVSGLHIDAPSVALIGGLLLLSLALPRAIARLPWRHEAALRAAVSTISIFAALALTGAMASYPVAALTSGFHDPMLHRIDSFLGFDWVALYAFVATHASLQLVGVLAYRSIYLIPITLFVYWAVTNQQQVSNRFILEFWLAAVVTLVLFIFMPAAGPLAYLWHGNIPYMPDSELCQPQLIPELRLETVRAINMGKLCGLVSAPSFHAVAAVLFIRSGFRVGRMKWPVLVLSTAMLAATPIEGTHYLIDILIGVAVAIFVLGVVQLAVDPSRRRAT